MLDDALIERGARALFEHRHAEVLRKLADGEGFVEGTIHWDGYEALGEPEKEALRGEARVVLASAGLA